LSYPEISNNFSTFPWEHIILLLSCLTFFIVLWTTGWPAQAERNNLQPSIFAYFPLCNRGNKINSAQHNQLNPVPNYRIRKNLQHNLRYHSHISFNVAKSLLRYEFLRCFFLINSSFNKRHGQ
jgi:hypothetical protein